jgi:hypothetical protein
VELLPRGDAPKPRGGWYAYRVTGAARLPSWAVEVALAIERTVQLGPEESTFQDEETVRSWLPGPGGPDGATLPTTGPSAPEARHRGQAPALQRPDPPGAGRREAEVQAVVLLRAPGRVNWLADVAEVIAEVEAAAGIRRGTDADRLAGSVTGRRSRLLVGPPLPGLVPIPAATAELHLAAGGARGLPPPLRRRRPAARGMRLSWRAGAGSVLTCEGPCGVSAQAVVALGGSGSPHAITPPPGGALVLRAWRAKRSWGTACGLVLGAAEAAGLGREAGRVAASARRAGWDAFVLQAEAALQLARAGDHRSTAPQAASRATSGTQVATLFEDCLAAGGLGRPAPGAGPLWALAVTP